MAPKCIYLPNPNSILKLTQRQGPRPASPLHGAALERQLWTKLMEQGCTPFPAHGHLLFFFFFNGTGRDNMWVCLCAFERAPQILKSICASSTRPVGSWMYDNCALV